MIQIFDVAKRRIGGIDDLDDLKVEKTLSSGDKTISFSYPKNGVELEKLKPENYLRTEKDEYVLKKVETGETTNKYTAQLNVEELEAQEFLYGFASETQTARDCLEFAFEGTGWKVGICTITKRRTVDIEESTNAWKVIQEVLDTYRAECRIHTLTKTVDIMETIGEDRGAYFMEGLNLRKLTVKSDTYDFYTRIYPVGADGITPEIILGVPYIDNHQYTDKVIPRYWKDERYTITENLIEDAQARLDAASKPYTAYTADVADLAVQSDEYDVLAYDIGDMVTLVSKTEKTKEKQRIVKMTEYPKHPEKNTCELSSVSKTFAQVQAETEERMKSDAINVSESRMKRTLRGGYWTKEQAQAAITSSEEKISLSVQETRTEARDIANKIGEDAREYTDRMNDNIVEKMTNEYSTRLDQTAKDLNIVIRSLESTVTSQGNEFTEFKQENETFFHHTSEGLEIGRKQDGGLMPFSTMLSDVRLEFRQEGKAVAYIQHDKLHITNVEAVRRWSVGAAEDGGYFDFISTRYGMGVKWREAQEEDTDTVQTMAMKVRSIRQEDYEQLIDESGVFEVITV